MPCREIGADQRGIAGARRGGKAEIDQLGAADFSVRQDDIVGANVAVDDPVAMDRREACGEAIAQRQHLVGFEPARGKDHRQRRA